MTVCSGCLGALVNSLSICLLFVGWWICIWCCCLPMVGLHKYSAIDESGVALKQPDYNANFVQFDFTKANVVHSNLGGFGPDAGDKTINDCQH